MTREEQKDALFGVLGEWAKDVLGIVGRSAKGAAEDLGQLVGVVPPTASPPPDDPKPGGGIGASLLILIVAILLLRR